MEGTELQQAVQNELSRILKDPAQLRALLVKQSETIEIMTPKADFYDAVTESSEWFEMSAAVKLLAEKDFGRNTAFQFLRDHNILRYNNEPYQEYVDRGYFRTIMQKYEAAGMTKINKKTMISSKGLDYIRKLIKEVA
jgi:anti-repressor protein